MNSNEPITLTRDVEGHIVPDGTRVTLEKGELAVITQSLGGNLHRCRQRQYVPP